ncbi:MAG: DUF2236 domain-containing protein [Acidobacteria bacterium]|nr:DUF2236 domain-containing protein [Acidobacteriota bacterium]
MPKHKALQEILTLDPVGDHQRIMFLAAAHEFPFDMVRSLEFALFRTFAVPSIGSLLDRTGEFKQRAQKRYDDTDLIMSQIYEFGYDSEQGRRALDRMNSLHGRFKIANDDFRYVLSTFIFEPIRWIDRFGWRPMVEQERLGLFYFWREVGKRMGIQDIPESFAEYERFNIEYEQSRFRYSDASRRTAEATRNLFLSWLLPKPLWKLGSPFVYALMDDRLCAAFGFPQPSQFTRNLVEGALRLRARLVRQLPERSHPFFRSQMKHRSYPNGYRTEELGATLVENANIEN